MSDQTAKVLISGVLLVHGLGHGGALAALIWIALRPGTNTSGRVAARSWLFPSLRPKTAAIVASAFWIVSLVGFVATVLALWLVPGDAWRMLAVGSAIVSTVGIALFFGTWPIFNTLAALVVNIAVLAGLLWLGWPPQAL